MLKKPCDKCPFRLAVRPYLRRARAQEIWDCLEKGGRFPCHATVDYNKDGEGRTTGDSRFCVGALALMESYFGHGAEANQAFRTARRLGLSEVPSQDVMDECYDDPDNWIDCNDS